MTKEAILRPVGLYRFPNAFSVAPAGALEVASNVVIDREGIVTSRRGFDNFTTMGADIKAAMSLDSYQEHLIAACLQTDDTTNLYYVDDANIFQTYPGSYEVPDPTDSASRIKFVQSNKNEYLTTFSGIKKLDVYTGPIVNAGAPRGLGGTYTLSGATGFLANNETVAYRIVWGYKDANENVISGVPSERLIAANAAGGARNVALAWQIPAVVDTSWFYQIYRSGSFASTIIPDDELQLVYEGNPSSAEVLAGEVTYTDTTPASLRQATIYTAPSQTEYGMANGNYEPPFAHHVAYFRNSVIYANTRLKHNLLFNLISASTLQVDDTITFTTDGTAFTLTAKAATTVASGEFKLFTAGTVSENIENTALELIRVINLYSSNTFLDAYYASNVDEIPGKIEIVRTDLTDVPVYVTSSRGSAFLPVLPSSGTTIATEADDGPNRIYVSKEFQPEAVPLYRSFDVGSAGSPIKGIYALRDSVVIVKDDGVYRLYGSSFLNMSISLLDNTTTIKAPNSATVLSNLVFFYSDVGVVAVSDSGIKIMSRSIENTLSTLSSYPNFKAITHATGYESDHKYILWTMTDEADVTPTQAFVYNLLTDSWTTWDLEVMVGFVNPVDNKLYVSYYAAAGNAPFAKERKTFTRLDYADDSFLVDVVSSSGTQVTLLSATDVVIGMTLKQDDLEAVVENVVGDVLTMSESVAFSASTAEVFTPIQNTIRTIPLSGREPLGMKRFTQLNMLFGDANFDSVDVEFTSDLYVAGETVALATDSTLGAAQRIRTYVPRNYTRANFIQLGISLNQSFSSLSLNGYGLDELKTQTRMR